uniref:Ig-like domain-containing protein n=1 Tax=Canis lupus dingo TaxID=286419 RepID=A0A8C0R2W7_CANLU
MTPTLMALLCLRTLPKPTIWAEPGSVIPWRTPVTLWCQGSLEAKVYRLHRERQSVTWDRQESLEPKDKAKFSITHMTGVYAGQYYCYYGSTTEWPEPSDSLELPSSHLGLHGKPDLSVLPSPVVPSGGHVTLQCDSWTGFRRSVLMKEGQSHRSENQRVRDMRPGVRMGEGRFGENQPLQSTAGLLPGVSRKPSPDPAEPCCDLWTLPCLSDVGYDRFALSKDRKRWIPGWSPAWAPCMEPQYAGRYCCYYRRATDQSHYSDPLDPSPLLGFHGKPNLSALPSPVVPSGGNVTLQCGLQTGFHRFVLMKEGEGQPSWTQDSQRTPSEVFQGLFPVGPVDPSLKWSFRCYGYYSNTLQVWSLSSDPLELLDSASDPKDYTVENLIRMGMATVMLVVLGILLFESWYSQRRTQDAASR